MRFKYQVFRFTLDQPRGPVFLLIIAYVLSIQVNSCPLIVVTETDNSKTLRTDCPTSYNYVSLVTHKCV